MGNQPTGAPADANNSGQNNFIYVVAALLAGTMGLHALRAPIEKGLHFYSQYHTQIRYCLFAILLSVLPVAGAVLWNRHLKRTEEEYVTAKEEGSVYLGRDIKTGEKVYIRVASRIMHTQLIGTTNSGKTSSMVLPCIVGDIEDGRGCIIIDGKSEAGFLDTIYSHVVRAGRQKDFHVFSLARPHISSTFNPFCQGNPEQITERVFSAYEFENEYYRNLQFSALRTVIALLISRGQTPMPAVIRECLRDKSILQGWKEGLNDSNLAKEVQAILDESSEKFKENYSGLVTILGQYCQGDSLPLFNSRNPEIHLADVLRQGKICYFQLPTMLSAQLSMATGRLLLQSLQAAISELQVSGVRLKSLYSIYLDDFNDYMYPNFVSLLNKSRSANIGVVFSHQSLGDLEKVGPEFSKIVTTNTNVKIIMSSNDPESAEYFAKVIGTVTAEHTTERKRRGFFGQQKTGDQSVRSTEEFLFHPNLFKTELGTGRGIVVIPHARGRVVKQVQFRMLDPLPAIRMPIRDLPVIDIALESTAPERRMKQIRDPLSGEGQPKQVSPGEEKGNRLEAKV